MQKLFVLIGIGVGEGIDRPPTAGKLVSLAVSCRDVSDRPLFGRTLLRPSFAHSTHLAHCTLDARFRPQKVLGCLRRQLSVATASSPQEEGPSSARLLLRKQEATRNAMIGLGTVAMLCGDHDGGCVLYERAAKCCR